jgi:regulator of sigma E protease
MSWVLAFLGFAALIILHEAGHFTAAKLVGMRVERFFLFFPPKIWSFKRGDTEYGIGAIPLGGFVKITGMNPEERVRVEIPAGARSTLGGTVVAMGDSPSGAGAAPDPPSDDDEDEDEGTVPATQYPGSYSAAPVWKRIFVIAAGPFVNLLIAFVILFALGFTLSDPTNLAVSSVEKGTPAEGKLHDGDRIVSINGVVRGDGTLDDQTTRLTDALQTLHCSDEQTDKCAATQTVSMVVKRDGAEKTINVRPFYDAAADRFRVGFSFKGVDLVPVDYGPAQSAGWALDRMWDVTSQTVGIVGRIFNAEERKQISGVVGTYEVTRQSFEFDTRQALFVLALISLSLAVINLFPFLPLDGGHIFWALVEKLRGRRVSLRTMERASVVGFVLVLMLFAIGLSNDIGRLTGDGFNVR